MKKNIPFNKHFGTENEIKYIKKSIKSGHISGRGPFTHKSEKLLKNKSAIEGPTSLISALTIALQWLQLRPSRGGRLGCYIYV